MFLACLVVLSAASARAAEMHFPYEAVVAGDDVTARSGPGKNYYATSKLDRGMQVTVHRHDPGGWFMISPPPGSISWIEASLVERQGNRGIVNVPADEQGRPGQAIVRIGSTLSDDHGYTGRRLATGDEVEIIGEQTLAMPQGPVRMLQIAPPLREYRWVKGDFIVPADAALRQHADSDPYSVPTQHRGSEKAVALASHELPELPVLSPKAEKKTATVEHAPSPEAVATHGQRMLLMEIDNRYADMMSRDISQWNPGELRAAYESLKSQVDSTLAAKIDVRLGALAEREKLYNNYARFSQLTAATERRDAELLGIAPPAAMMNVVVQTPAGLTAPQMMTQSLAVAAPTVQLGQPSRTPPMSFAGSAPSALPALPAPASQQAIMQAGGFAPTAGGVMQASGVQMPAAANPYSGAGIIQATNLRGAGVPQYMITAADGKFLAFIESTQDLRPYVGQSMGLVGPRSQQPRLRADLIQVQSMTPVQLGR
ncbi:hypothetical protein AYO47_07095 [Planctomyces sp. SCGC AG-212-M04]|nr:hypothetical protein AYO47_07095 [Planctomyces sp. SCGC AG-212-M04]